MVTLKFTLTFKMYPWAGHVGLHLSWCTRIVVYMVKGNFRGRLDEGHDGATVLDCIIHCS